MSPNAILRVHILLKSNLHVTIKQTVRPQNQGFHTNLKSNFFLDSGKNAVKTETPN